MNWTLIGIAWLTATVGFLLGCCWAATRTDNGIEDDYGLPPRRYLEALRAQLDQDSDCLEAQPK